MPVDRGLFVCYGVEVLQPIQMNDEYLTRCVVNPINRSVNIYSNEGNHKTINCQTVDEFINVLGVIRNLVSEDELVFTD